MALFKRPSSQYWYYSLQINGKRVFKSTRETDRKRAKLVWIDSLRRFRDRELHGAPSRITLGEMIELYMRDHSARLKARTHETDRSLKNRILRGFSPNIKLRSLTPHHIERYIAKRSGRVKPGTINRELTFLQGLFTKAVRWGFAATNPLTLIKKLKEERKPERFLAPAQKDKLLASCRDSLKPLVGFAMKTGMRMSEIIELEWKNVNLDKNRVYAVGTKAHKTRVIPISPATRETLKRLPKRSDRVFTQDSGKPWIVATLGKWFVRAARKARLPQDFTFHDLRHTFARDLLDRGVDIYTVSRLLGHSSLRVTERYLSHNMPGAEEAIGKLDQSVVKSVVSRYSAA
ncbi:MAG: tyrosine-type recombinase/integrase [Elusimicrobiota bacterium]